MGLARSFWVVQMLLLPVRIALAACAVGAIALSVFLLWKMSSLLFSPMWPLFVLLALGLMIFAIAFGAGILGCLVWAFAGLVAAHRGDASRLGILRTAEFTLAAVLTTLFWFLYPRPSDYTLWSGVVAFFTVVQWSAWYGLRAWKAPDAVVVPVD